MKVKQAIKDEEQIFNPKTKFGVNLKRVLTLYAGNNYTTELFNICFDKTLKDSECEMCKNKSTKMVNRITYCEEHLPKGKINERL